MYFISGFIYFISDQFYYQNVRFGLVLEKIYLKSGFTL